MSANRPMPAVASGGEAETVPLPSGRLIAVPAASSMRMRHGRRDWVARRALALADLLSLSVALVAAVLLEPGGTELASVALFAIALPAWVVLFRAYGLYDRDTRRIGNGVLDDVPQLFHALVIGGLGLWLLSRLVADQLAFAEMALFGMLAILLVPIARFVARAAVLSTHGPERTLILGGGEALAPLVRKLRDHPGYALDPVGFVGDREEGGERPADLSGERRGGGEPILPILSDASELDVAALIERYEIEHVIASPLTGDHSATHDALEQCRRLGVKVSVLPRHVDAMGPSVVIGDIEGITVISLNPLVLSRSSRWLKRITDVTGAGIGLIVTAPLIAIAALAIKIDSRGSVFFSQERLGRDGARFRLHKLRTMASDAEQRRDELAKLSLDPNWLKLDRDPRVTRVGRVLRALSIDELPQLWNVLRGDMSLVGPRPLIEQENDQVVGWESARLDLRPGITGLWQVLGRTNIPFEEMVKLDYLYVTNWSLWNDIKLLLRTFPAVASRRGVN